MFCSQLYKQTCHIQQRTVYGNMKPSTDHKPQPPVNSITTENVIDEHAQPDTFTHPLHNLLGNMKITWTYQLLETFKSQFAKDETSIGTTHLTKMHTDRGDSESVLQRPYALP